MRSTLLVDVLAMHASQLLVLLELCLQHMCTVRNHAASEKVQMAQLGVMSGTPT
jgi:hypothetical protein